MKQLLKTFTLVLAFLIIGSNTVLSQDFSIEETLKYLNEIFNSSQSTAYMYDIALSSDGLLNITRKHKNYLGKSGFSQSDNIHANITDITQAYISKDYTMCNGTTYPNSGGKHIKLLCKNKTDCIYDPQSQEKYTCSVDLFLEISDYDYQRALNALNHLIILGKNKFSSIIQNKPKDPFAPQNFNQSNSPNNDNSEQKDSPCNIKMRTHMNGTQIKYLDPVYVGFESNCSLFLSIQSRGLEYALTVSPKYFYKSLKIKGSLVIKFWDDQRMILSDYRNEIMVVQKDSVYSSIFTLNNSAVEKLSNIKIRGVEFYDINGFLKTIVFNRNFDFAIIQLNCLRN
jgi:hypothetical protein